MGLQILGFVQILLPTPYPSQEGTFGGYSIYRVRQFDNSEIGYCLIVRQIALRIL
jgi:hypothetical protein